MFTFQYKGKTCQYPNALSEITLRQRIAWQEQYGDALEARALEVETVEEEFEKELERTVLSVDAALQSFAFYTGVPEFLEGNTVDVGQLLNVYYACQQSLAEQELAISNTEQHHDMHAFAGKLWRIAPPVVSPDSEITFNEFLISKEVVRQLHMLAAGSWVALPYLCCVYFRLDGEPFSEALAKEDGERFEQLLDLPMDKALTVAFFLSSSMDLFKSISAYSAEQREKDPTWDSSLTVGAGFPS
jgi:hypothetical protein